MAGLGYAYFFTCATIAVLGALFTVTAKNPIRGAMGLMAMVVSIAGLFLALHAEFLAAVQLIVYAGAIVVLFLFVIMLLGPDAATPQDHRGRTTRALGGGLFALLAIFAGYLVVRPAWGQAHRLPSVPREFGSVDAIGRVLFHDAVVPFELSSALLMVAIIGAVAVARGKHASDAEKALPVGAAKPAKEVKP
jgi:NADH-quinone oxidoreductase subunit J